MDDRIKELARQAYCAERVADNPKWKESQLSDLALNDLQGIFERFAELIIQECIGQTKELIHNDLNSEWDAALRFAMDDIRKHFGLNDEHMFKRN